MMDSTVMIQEPLTVLTALAGTAAFFFLIERVTQWRLFSYFPPLLFIYAVPLILSNTGVLTRESPVYDAMGTGVLPFLLVVMLLKVDVVSTVRVMGKGALVMLCGTAGVVLGAPLACALVKSRLGPTAWKAFGTLAGSWIGGTANMAAVSQAIDASGAEFGLAVLGDNVVYLVWLPILLASRSFAKRFGHFTRAQERSIDLLDRWGVQREEDQQRPEMRHLLYLLFLGLGITLAANGLSRVFPEVPPVLTSSSWRILLVTTLGLGLSVTPARRIPGSRELAMALLYVFVAGMGARADLSGLGRQAVWFVAAAYAWIAFHGTFCVLGARLFRADIHLTAIASAANIGAAASAPVVAAHHNPRLVPVSILMALLGYAVGNYGALLAAWLCHQVS
jgi:uncharacterized membrane protein